MIWNYFKIAWRNFKKEKAFTLTNVIGMSLGITCGILIYLWIQDERSFNTSDEAVCYVMVNHFLSQGDIKTYNASPQPLRAVLEEKYSAIDKAAVVSWNYDMAFKKGDKIFQRNGTDASPELFDIFQITFKEGDHRLLFDQPNALVVSESFAEAYFGKHWRSLNVIGKGINNDQGETFTLSGVFQNMPDNATLDFDFVIPYEFRLSKRTWLNHWGNFSNRMFVRLAENVSLEQANAQIETAIIDNRTDEPTTEKIFLQPYKEMYLYNNYEQGKVAGGRIEYVRLLTIAAILILLLASINFINLSTARSATRTKETGIRKVLGAMNHSLRLQFIIESILVTLLAFGISMVVVMFLLPHFNTLTGKDIQQDYFSAEFIGTLIGCVLTLGVISGVYPAYYLSKLKVTKSLKGLISRNYKEVVFRKSLIVFQFMITIIMIIGAVSIYKQVSYIESKNIGFEKEHLVEVYMGDMNPTSDFQVYKNELLKRPGIVNISATNQNILNIGNTTSDPEWDGKGAGEIIQFNVMCSDPDFLATTGIELNNGRDFEWGRPADTTNFIINEAARKAMRMEDPIGQKFEFWDREGQIIGVIDDVHIHSLHAPIEPFIISYNPSMTYKALVRIEADKTTEAIASLKDLHNTFNPGKTFYYNFISDMYKNQYQSEYLVKDMVFYFTILAILISCLGLISLIAYDASRRTKEIGIQKVLGASIPVIIRLLIKDFVFIVVLAFIIAAPLAYYLVNNWLENFSYRIKLSWNLFVLSIGIALIITISVLAIQVLKAAIANPIKSLRTE